MIIFHHLKHISIALLLATLTTTMSPIVSALTLPQNEKREISPGQASSTYQDPTGRSIYNETVVDSTTQTFSWSAVPNASKYALYVRNLDTNVLEVIEENLTSTSYATSSLHAGYHYKWNVRAKDNSNRGGWMSDGYWFRVKDGIAEAPVTDTGNIRILVLNENDIPQKDIVVTIDCVTTSDYICPSFTEQGVTPTDATGFATFPKSKYPYSQVKYSVGNTFAITNYETNSTRFAIAVKDSKTGIVDTYDAYNITNDNEALYQFMEGVYDTASIQFSLEGLLVGGTTEAVSITANKIKDQVIKKYGATIAGKFALKAVPGVGTVFLVGTGAYIAYDNYDETKKCLSFTETYFYDDPVSYYDNDSTLEKTPAYFCGKIITKGGLTFAGAGASRLTGGLLTSYVGKRVVQNKVFKTFKYDNKRHNLLVYTNKVGAEMSAYDAHHLMPDKFDSTFIKYDINIHDPQYLRWWKNGKSGGTHQTYVTRYNMEWEDWILLQREAGTLSKTSIFTKMTELDNKYKQYYGN